MAFSKKPTDWVAGISEDGSNLIVPLTSIPGLDAADADATTGDIRKIFLGLCTMMAGAWNTVGSDGQPTKMTIQTSERMDGEDDVQRNFSLAFSNTISAEDVAAEPS